MILLYRYFGHTTDLSVSCLLPDPIWDIKLSNVIPDGECHTSCHSNVKVLLRKRTRRRAPSVLYALLRSLTCDIAIAVFSPL